MRKPGRKPLPPESVRVAAPIRMRPAKFAELKARAEKFGMSAGEYVEFLLTAVD